MKESISRMICDGCGNTVDINMDDASNGVKIYWITVIHNDDRNIRVVEDYCSKGCLVKKYLKDLRWVLDKKNPRSE